MCVSNTHLSDTGCIYRAMLTYFIAHFLARCATNVCEGGTEANESDGTNERSTNDDNDDGEPTLSSVWPLCLFHSQSISSSVGPLRRATTTTDGGVAAAIVARTRRATRRTTTRRRDGAASRRR